MGSHGLALEHAHREKENRTTLVPFYHHTSSADQDPMLMSPSKLDHFPTANAATLGFTATVNLEEENTLSPHPPVSSPSLALTERDSKEDGPYFREPENESRESAGRCRVDDSGPAWTGFNLGLVIYQLCDLG